MAGDPEATGDAAPGGRVGTYQAFFADCFSVGSILAYLGMPLLVRAGWHWVFLVPALLCLPLLAFVPTLRLWPLRSGRRSLRLPHIVGMQSPWILGLYHALSYGSMLSLGNWVPSLLAEVSGHRTATQLARGWRFGHARQRRVAAFR